ncbi:MAG: ABC-type heme uptake system ATPase component HmuV [Rhodobacteraceae bacterium HLUCCA12]|nr:MAG: ABC-type heme uptake system ATPase component HmuV [Rhodobacteraceae bacterium HLUCCA12]
MLNATNITVELGRKRILHGVDFTAGPGEITAIVGHNGSGKTTLLRAMTGEIACGGQITLDGDDLRTLPPAALAARRAVLAQATTLAFPFTVHEVVRLGLTGQSALLPGAETLPERALHRVGLEGFGGRFFQELSGGEQQRVQLARVLVQVWQPVVDDRARWLFLDEPVASLDIGHQLQVMRLAAEFANAGGGVVAVMHDLNLTAMFARSVTLMAGGQVLAAGPVAQVFTSATLSAAYDCDLRVSTPPPGGGVFVLPQAVA